jgi:hypothetical protein
MINLLRVIWARVRVPGLTLPHIERDFLDLGQKNQKRKNVLSVRYYVLGERTFVAQGLERTATLKPKTFIVFT